MSAALKTGGDARALRTTKFPDIFNKKVDMTKVNLAVIKKWISDEATKILKNDDDVVIETIFNELEPKFPSIKGIHQSIVGFFDKDAMPFCTELWRLCLSAQESPNGIPKELLEAKKMELIQERAAEDRAREEAKKREAEEREHEREMARIRDRERDQRGRGGRFGRGRGRDHDRSYDRRDTRFSRSPPPRRREPPRLADSYVPGGGRDRRDFPRRRRPSPSYGRSPSRSRSPPRQRRKRNPSAEDSRSPPPRRSRAASSDAEERRGKRFTSPRRRRRSPSHSDDARSPPDRRRRRHPSRSRSRSPPRRRHRDDSRSRTPPPRRKSRQFEDDLIDRPDRSKRNVRLSPGRSSYSGSPRGQLPGSRDGKAASGGAKDEVGNDE